MKPVRTRNSTLVYTGPTPDISDLHCQRVHPGRIRSIWQLAPDERARIAAGANIALDILVEPMPPMVLFVIDEEGVGEDDPAVAARLREWSEASR